MIDADFVPGKMDAERRVEELVVVVGTLIVTSTDAVPVEFGALGPVVAFTGGAKLRLPPPPPHAVTTSGNASAAIRSRN